jgi:NAD(P)-dependent dehydrogenase (short-subunit alcohol dehydrogenase family)
MRANSVVIVSGASRGLGAAVARRLATTGAAVALVARSEENLLGVADDVARLGAEPLVLKADVADYGACYTAVETTLKHFGRVDSLVNNAGIIQPISEFARADPVEWRHNIQVNLVGPFNLIRAAADALRKQKGRVVNVSSGAANQALVALSAYCAAKAALNHFTQVLAVEETSITSVAVRPGVVDTDMQVFIRNESPKAMPAESAAYYQQIKERGELQPPEIPARAIAWLALYAPSYLSGKFLDFDDPQIDGPAREVFGES